MPDRPSIAQALNRAAARLERAGLGGAGVPPRREALALWAAVQGGVKPGDVWLRRDMAPPAPVAARFWDAVTRRASGIPFAYAVGHVTFRRLELTLDPRALIPRLETEGLVELALNRVKGEVGTGKGGVVADIGTGCGCIALALATEGDFDRVIAVECSGAAAALARENVERIRPRTVVEVREGDLLAPLAGERCRAIVANPPYLTAAEYEALEPAVKRYEPREALVSGRDGLDATRALFAEAAGRLAPGGVLALEIDERRAEAVRGLARAYGWRRIEVHQDWFGRPRYALAFPREA